MKKPLFCSIVFAFLLSSASAQVRYRFDLAGAYGSHINNSNSMGYIAGARIGEYYKPFYDKDFFAGASFEIYKLEKSNALYYPIAVKLGYFGTTHNLVPVIDLGIGYGIHNYSDSIGNIHNIETGGLYSTIAIGMAYNHWKSCPYVTVGYNNFSTGSTVQDISKAETRFEKIKGNLFNVKFGFLMK